MTCYYDLSCPPLTCVPPLTNHLVPMEIRSRLAMSARVAKSLGPTHRRVNRNKEGRRASTGTTTYTRPRTSMVGIAETPNPQPCPQLSLSHLAPPAHTTASLCPCAHLPLCPPELLSVTVMTTAGALAERQLCTRPYVQDFTHVILVIISPLHKPISKWLKNYLPKSYRLKWQRLELRPGSSGW